MQTARDITASLPGRPMLHALAKCWWLLLLRGIAAVLFGLLAFIWPGLTLVTLVLLYGAFALVDGVISLIAAFTGSAKPVPTWWLVMVGLLGLAAGIVTFAWPATARSRRWRRPPPGSRRRAGGCAAAPRTAGRPRSASTTPRAGGLVGPLEAARPAAGR